MYARLRGLDKKIISAEIPEILQKYNLLDVSKNRVSTFSGGMKRRVAMSLAVIGSPKLIILDEPTTGLDPLLRRQVWDNIRELKRKSLVLLTTHNMEEADALGDNIAIMSGGKLRACGTSLFLKNRFGSGYQIQLVSSLNHVEKICETIARLLPQAKIVSQDSGNITLSLPRSSLVAFPNFYRWLEEQEFESENNEKSLKSWSFSNSTLEEVFLKIANSEKTVNEEIEALGSGIQKTKCVICNERDSEEVVLLTKTGIEVTAPNLVCLYCATGEIRSEDSKNGDELDLNWNLYGNTTQTQKNRTQNADQVNLELPKEQDVPKYNKEFDIIISQFTAILYKNFKLTLSGRKTLVAQTIFMIAAALAFWRVGSLLDDDSPTDLICPNGTIKNVGCGVSIGDDLGNLETLLFSDLHSDYYSASVIDPDRFFQPGNEGYYPLFQDLNSIEYFTALRQNFSDILKRDTFSFISDSTCQDRR
jgi:ABC-type multidrug transport system ATPase subunit